MQWKEALSLWVIVTNLGVGAILVTNMPQLEKQPLGLLMCKQLCCSLSGCSTVTYNIHSLHCHIGRLQNNTQLTKDGIYVMKTAKGNNIADGNITCPHRMILVKTRAMIFRCIKYGREQDRQISKFRYKITKETVNLNDAMYDTCVKLYSFCDERNIKKSQSSLSKLGHYVKRNGGRKISPFALHQYLSLRSNKCSLSMADRRDDTILHKATEYGFIDIVRCVILKGNISVDARGRFGNTPIMLATRTGHTQIFKLLHKVGSNLAIPDMFSRTILHIAVLKERTEIYKEIVRSGSFDINTRTRLGSTPVMRAVYFGNEDAFHYLEDNGCHMRAVDKVGQNVLHIASSVGRLNLVKYIISHHLVDKERRDYSGKTSIMIAALKGRDDVFDYLHAKTCNLSVVDKEGNTIFHMALMSKNKDIVLSLIKFKGLSGWNVVNNKGKTSLDLVAKHTRKALFGHFSHRLN